MKRCSMSQQCEGETDPAFTQTDSRAEQRASDHSH